jgi:hypothetical protein
MRRPQPAAPGIRPTATEQATPPAEADLEAEFPGWHVWRTTDAGTWWAARRGRAWTVPRTLAADTAQALRAKLHEAAADDDTTGRFTSAT